MMALTTPYLWYATRATGLVALLLFTLTVSLGTLVANRIGGTIVGRFEINELHRSISMVAITFLGLHIVTTLIDSYVNIGPVAVLVPFASSYKTLGVSFGAIAFDLIVAVWVSSLLKVRIKNATWRFIHWFSWLAFVTALVHAVTTGTDGKTGVGLILVGLCALTGLVAALWRFFGRPTRAGGRTALSPLVRILAPTAPPPRMPGRNAPFPRGARPNNRGGRR